MKRTSPILTNYFFHLTLLQFQCPFHSLSNAYTHLITISKKINYRAKEPLTSISCIRSKSLIQTSDIRLFCHLFDYCYPGSAQWHIPMQSSPLFFITTFVYESAEEKRSRVVGFSLARRASFLPSDISHSIICASFGHQLFGEFHCHKQLSPTFSSPVDVWARRCCSSFLGTDSHAMCKTSFTAALILSLSQKKRKIQLEFGSHGRDRDE